MITGIDIEKLMNGLPLKEDETSTLVDVTNPGHYHKGGIDVIEFSKKQFSKEELKGFFRINALKYITRYDRKNGVEDLIKAKDYVDRLVELEGANNG